MSLGIPSKSFTTTTTTTTTKTDEAPVGPLSGTPAQPTATPYGLAPVDYASAGDASSFDPSAEPPMDLSGMGEMGAPSTPAMDVYSAARALRDHFALAEGVGMDAAGQGTGDNNIGTSELSRLASPGSGAPQQLQEAARFLLEHMTALRSVDQGAGKASGNPQEVHLSPADLDAFLSKAPASTFSGPMGMAMLSGQRLISG